MSIVKCLEQYSEIKTKIRLLEIEVEDNISIGSQSDDPMPGRCSARDNVSMVERQAERICLIQAEIRSYRRFINKVNRMLGYLTKDEERLIRALYEHGVSVRDLAERYCVCEDAIYKRKNRVLKKLENFSNCFLI